MSVVMVCVDFGWCVCFCCCVDFCYGYCCLCLGFFG